MLPDFLYSVWANIVAAAVVAAGIAVWGKVMTRWSAPQAVVYGLVAFAALLVIFERIWFRPSSETQIRRWLERGEYSIRRVLSKDHAFFFEVTERGEKKVVVHQSSYEGAPIVIEARIDVAPGVRSAIEALGPKGKHEFLIGIQLSMMQYGIGFDGIGDPLSAVILQDMFVYDDSMSEREFIRRVFFVTRAIYYFHQLLHLRLSAPIH